MTGKEEEYRASAIRALCTILDVRTNLASFCRIVIIITLSLLQASMMQSIERYMKQAIVDRNPAVSSAALVSSLVRLSLFCCPSGNAC